MCADQPERQLAEALRRKGARRVQRHGRFVGEIVDVGARPLQRRQRRQRRFIGALRRQPARQRAPELAQGRVPRRPVGHVGGGEVSERIGADQARQARELRLQRLDEARAIHEGIDRQPLFGARPLVATDQRPRLPCGSAQLQARDSRQQRRLERGQRQPWRALRPHRAAPPAPSSPSRPPARAPLPAPRRAARRRPIRSSSNGPRTAPPPRHRAARRRPPRTRRACR